MTEWNYMIHILNRDIDKWELEVANIRSCRLATSTGYSIPDWRVVCDNEGKKGATMNDLVRIPTLPVGHYTLHSYNPRDITHGVWYSTPHHDLQFCWEFDKAWVALEHREIALHTVLIDELGRILVRLDDVGVTAYATGNDLMDQLAAMPQSIRAALAKRLTEV